MKKLLALDNRNKLLLIAFLLLGLLSLAMTFFPSEAPVEEPTEPTSSVDTFIPRGAILVPIEVANSDALSSLVGDLGGVVDLYLAATEKQKGGIKVGSRLKLVRAPRNPQQYAVLVRNDEDSQRLLKFSGPFIAVVQNPESQGQEVAGPSPSKVQITYQN